MLEPASHPIRILEPERVEVLLSSKELGDKYGEAPVAVTFRYGEGEVFHMISPTSSSGRSSAPGAPAWWPRPLKERGLEADEVTAEKIADLSLGEVESAASSARMFANVLAEKKRRAKDARAASKRPSE